MDLKENLMSTKAVLDQMQLIVGRRGIVKDSDTAPYLQDERGHYFGKAALILKPASVEECSQIISMANKFGIGVIPQGGNTGYCGGATPFDSKKQIILNLSRMNNLREFDEVNSTMTVEAGAVLSTVHALAEKHDLIFPLSMGSKDTCQIGGVLSTNGGGISVLRYGSARNLVLGLEAVLPNGEVLSDLNGLRKDNTGYDLGGLFVGAEGTLGLITAAVLKLYPKPHNREVAIFGVTSTQSACDFLGRAERLSDGRIVSAEYISRESLNMVLANIPGTLDPFDKTLQHMLLVELATSEIDTDLRKILEQLFEEGVISKELITGVIAESGQQETAFWKLRESIPEAERREGGSVKHDISVRISQVPEFLDKAKKLLDNFIPHRLSVFGHIGDGNIHFNLLPPLGVELGVFKDEFAHELTEKVHDLSVQLGGSFSAEHGVGILKRDELLKYKSRVSINLMRTIKRAIDPNNIMNPGKVIE
tara:strand:+ start:15425 stop:16858 length:1434 start_codon:yes stop_codon:yes gene_type:complete